MGAGKSEALAVISKIKGCSLAEARAYCVQVQGRCKVSPPFSAIAGVVQRHGGASIPIQAVADEASGQGGPERSEIRASQRVREVVHTVREVVVPSVFQIDLDDYPKGLQPSHKPLIESITRSAIDKLVVESIEGKTIGFTGHGPYHETDLEKLAMRLGATPDRDGIAWDDLDWIVVGRDDFDPEYLAHSVEAGGIRYLSQEAFLGLVFMGESLVPECSDNSHPGFSHLYSLTGEPDFEVQEPEEVRGFEVPPKTSVPIKQQLPAPVMEKRPVTSATTHRPSAFSNGAGKSAASADRPTTALPFGWSYLVHPSRAPGPGSTDGDSRWPTTTSDSSGKSATGDAPNLNVESDLKKLGYSVARDVSVYKRRKVLEYAVRNLGLKKVADHLAFLIRYFQNNPGKHDAVGNWRDDLAWLQSHDWVGSRK